MNTNQPQNNLRVIKTARSIEQINEAIAQGFTAIIKPVVPSPEIKSKFAIIREKATGIVQVISDYRSRGYDIIPDEDSPFETLIPFTYYYPHHFESPYAAYLIPKDITVDETVWVEDVIEDIVGNRWNQGDTYRLKSGEAIWDGSALTLNQIPLGNNFSAIG